MLIHVLDIKTMTYDEQEFLSPHYCRGSLRPLSVISEVSREEGRLS
jgi:hypothetical protein